MRFARGAAAKGHQWPARAAVPRAQHESTRPMILGAHGASNPIDEVGCLCAGRLPLAEKEDYCFTKTGSGFSKLFFMARKLPDGSVKCVLYGPVWKSKFYGAFVLHRRVVLHAIDATPG